MKNLMMSNLSQEDKEKAATIVRLFSELSQNARPMVLAELVLKKGHTGTSDMEVML